MAMAEQTSKRARSAKWRIAVVGMGCENCTFSTAPTVLADFSPMLDQEALRGKYHQLVSTPIGTRLDLDETQFLEQDFSDAEYHYCCYCRAIPGGPITAEAFATLRSYIDKGLADYMASGPIDGVYLDLHGAMFATGSQDAEGIITTLVRSIVGPKPFLCASFDLHGNFSETMRRNLDMTTAYRTAPHIDIIETRRKALHMLLSALRKGERPSLVFVPIPLAVSGEMSNTNEEPAKSLYSSLLHHTDSCDGITDVSILIGYVWGDEPRSGASVLVTGHNKSVAEREGLRVARAVWANRGDFKFGVEAGSMDAIITKAVAAAGARSSDASNKPVIISDSGDNPTAGGVGDTPSMVGCMVEQGVVDAVVQGPVDSAAVERCVMAGKGATVELSIGGKLDYLNAKPLTITGVVQCTSDTEQSYAVNVNAGTNNPPLTRTCTMPPAAVVAVRTNGGGTILVTLTAARKPFHFEKDFQMIGIEPTQHPILVVKIGYLVPDLERMMAVNLMAISPGAVYADVSTMPYKHIRRPIFPLDTTMDWAPSVCE